MFLMENNFQCNPGYATAKLEINQLSCQTQKILWDCIDDGANFWKYSKAMSGYAFIHATHT